MISKHIFTTDVVSGKQLWINELNSTGDLIVASTNFDIENTLKVGEDLSIGGNSVLSGNANISGDLYVGQNLTVKGTTTTLDTVNVTVDDHNIELGSVDNPTNITAEGGGITLKGDEDKTFNWQANYNGSWLSSENLGVTDGKYVFTDKVRARDGAGLFLEDDGGNGIFIEDEGNVGIGTTSPDHKLHIAGGTPGMKLEGSQPRIWLRETDQTDLNTLIRNNNSIFQIDTASDTDAYIQNRFSIDHGNGNVRINDLLGIGKDPDGYHLDVAAPGASANGIRVQTFDDSSNAIVHIGGGGSLDIKFKVDGSGSVTTAKDVTIGGNLTVNGTTTTVNSATITVDDKNIELGSVASPTNTTADGGGITLKGTTDKEFKWTNLSNAWNSSEHLGIADGKYLFTDKVRARDGAGLFLEDDGGNGIFVQDGGNVGIDTTSPEEPLDVRGTIKTKNENDNSEVKLVSSGGMPHINFQRGTSANWKITSKGNGSQQVLTTSFDTSELMTVQADGNVGIGTTTPDSLLEIAGATNPELRITDTNPSTASAATFRAEDGGATLGAYSNHPLYLVTNNSTKMTVLANGNVGIGATSPSARLVVEESNTSPAHLGRFTNDSGQAIVTIRAKSDNLSILEFADVDDANVGAINYSHASNYMRLKTADVERLSIDSSGRVGIGALSPGDFDSEANHLVVKGQNNTGMTICAGNTTSRSNIYFADGTSGDQQYRGGITYDHGTDDLSLRAGGVEYMWVADGKVGICTASPTQTLTVDGNLLLNKKDVDGGNQALLFSSGGAADHATLDIYDKDGNDGARITANGNSWLSAKGGSVGIGTTSPESRLHISQPSTTIGGNDLTKGCILLGSSTEGIGIDNNEIIKKGPGATSSFVIGNANSEGDILLRTNQANRVVISNSSTAISGDLSVSGDLTVNGTTTTVNSTTVTVDDKNIELGSVASPTNTTADGGGVTLKGATDKEFKWTNASNAWNSSEHLGIADGKYLFTDKVRARDGAGLFLEDDGGNGIFIEDGGNVGIGTATPDRLLEIHGAQHAGNLTALKLTNNMANDNGEGVSIEFGGNDTRIMGSIESRMRSTSSNSDLIFSTNPGTNNTDLSERMRIAANGNVGIGTTSPDYKLHIAGGTPAMKLEGTQPRIWLSETDQTDLNTLIRNHGSLFQIDTATDADSFVANRLTINHTSGNVGIGTTTPAYKLEVLGGEASINGWRSRVSSHHANPNYNTEKTYILLAAYDSNSTISGEMWAGRNGDTKSNRSYRMPIFVNSTAWPETPTDTEGTMNVVMGSAVGNGANLLTVPAIRRVTVPASKTGSVDIDYVAIELRSGAWIHDTHINFTGHAEGDDHLFWNIIPESDLTVGDIVSEHQVIGANMFQKGSNIGIGTRDPDQLLHVNTTSPNSARIKVQNSEGYAEIGTDGTDGFLTAGGTEVFRFDSAGKAGIGTASPSAKLQIVNTSTSTAESHGLSVQGGGNSTGQGYSFRALDLDGNTDFFIRGDGSVGIATSNPESRLHIPQPGTTIGGNDLTKGCILLGSSTEGVAIDNNEIIKKGPANDSDFVIGNANSAGRILLRTNEANRVVISNSSTDISGNLSVSGDLTVTGKTITNDVEVVSTSNGVVFEGSVTDNHEGLLKAGTLTADRTYALPNKSGTVAMTSDIPTNNNQLTNGAGYITATLSNEQVQDIVGGMVSGNTESGITVSYQDGDGTLDFSVASQTDNNFTNALKSKLDGIAAGATNVTNNNQLTNGAGYITATLSNEQVQDIVGGMVSGNTESGITVSYQDGDGTLDFSVASQTDNNFTNALKSKLDGIAAGATNTTPGGSNTQIQFNNNGSFGGSSSLTFDGTFLTCGNTFIAESSIEVGPGGAGFAFIDFKNDNTEDGDIRIAQGLPSINQSKYDLYIGPRPTVSATCNLHVQGDIVAHYASDKRLKNNISNISSPIEKIKQINGVNFEWSDKQSTYTGKDVGVIAQEVEKVLPEVVAEREDGYLAVKYEKIIPLLIEAIKDQQKEIEELKSKLS